MVDLYLISFLVCSILFALVVAYSIYQTRKKSDNDLFDSELELGSESDLDDSQSTKKEAPTLARKQVDNIDRDLADVGDVKHAPTLDKADKASSPADQSVGNQQAASTKPTEPVLEQNEAVVFDGPPKFDETSSQVITELVARVKNPEAVEQQALLSLFRTHDLKFNRKVHIYGLNQLTDIWQDIEFELPSARFVELGVAIQLADREGGMTKKNCMTFNKWRWILPIPLTRRLSFRWT